MIKDVAQAIGQIKQALEDKAVGSALSLVRDLVLVPLRPSDYQKLDRYLVSQAAVLLDSGLCEPQRVAVLGGYTTRSVVHALRVHLFAEGYYAEIYEAEYDTFRTEIIDETSELYRFRPELVLIAITSGNISVWPRPGLSADDVLLLARQEVSGYRQLWDLLHSRLGARVMQQNFESQEGRVLGRLESKVPWSASRYVSLLNELFWQEDGAGMFILDVQSLAVSCGVRQWSDPRWYCHGKFGFDPNLVFEYARLFQGTFRALLGKGKKCLVLDLDNTLWGGVIGDDGLGGIALGNISAVGEAHFAFCDYIRRLGERGVILAVNSKNDPVIAKQVFTDHAEMPIKLEAISSFQANWDSKSLNMTRIAKELNIGLDSIVFVDDNPVECEEVRLAHPDVTVLELSGDSAYFVRWLDQLHLFDQVDITAEDLARSGSFLVQQQITGYQSSPEDLGSFLQGLAMTGDVALATQEDIPRLEQIFKKTNQFNMTSQRYGKEELVTIIQDSRKWLLACRLKDRLVDYGLVAAVAGVVDADAWVIDNWVMSCRVFSRTFEEFVFNNMVALARARGCSSMRAVFIPSEKNKYAAGVYERLGLQISKGLASERVLDLTKAFDSLTYVKGL